MQSLPSQETALKETQAVFEPLRNQIAGAREHLEGLLVSFIFYFLIFFF